MEPQDNKQTTHDLSKSNFFTGITKNQDTNLQAQVINPIPQAVQTQAFPPMQTQFSPQVQSQNGFYNIFPQQNPQQSQNQQSFLEKVNSTATGVFDYIKSKAPPLPTNLITKNLLDNVDPLTIVS